MRSDDVKQAQAIQRLLLEVGLAREDLLIVLIRIPAGADVDTIIKTVKKVQQERKATLAERECQLRGHKWHLDSTHDMQVRCERCGAQEA